MKIAIVHEWLVSYAGSERVLEEILLLYPDADLFATVDFLPSTHRHMLLGRTPRTSFIQHLPFARRKYRSYLPLMPLAVERFDLRQYDLIISSSHAVAKGVKTSSSQLHVCYCHTPMRYAWDLREQYLNETGLNRGLKGFLVRSMLDRLQGWDMQTSSRVDQFVANSAYIADRIMRAYGRTATVIYPPVDIGSFTPVDRKEDFYLAASRMVPYKKLDLIVEAFSFLPDKTLKVVGDGPEFAKIRSLAGANVELLGYLQSDALQELMQRSKAFIFAAEEDFGIIPVEAQACGTPVIAYGKGGARETVIPVQAEGSAHSGPDPTGVFFAEQTTPSLINAIHSFESNAGRFDPRNIRKNAEQFSKERFRREFQSFVDRTLKSGNR